MSARNRLYNIRLAPLSPDELSRLKTETRGFTDLKDTVPAGYALNYNYHLTGGIKSITDQFNYQVYYAADKAGR